MTASDLSSEFFTKSRLKEGEAGLLAAIEQNFESFPATTHQKLENFTNWVRHRDLARFLFKSEIFGKVLNVPGAIFECGVLYGGGVTTWLHLSEIFEPVNFSRRIFGFDTFSGFPDIAPEDIPQDAAQPEFYNKGVFDIGSARDHLFDLVKLVDQTRKIPQLPRLNLIEGDVRDTVPAMLEQDSSLLVSLLYLDVDLYEPTMAVLKACLPRMPKGAIIVFDELCYPDWPGETRALFETFDMNKAELHRCSYVPNISYLIVG